MIFVQVSLYWLFFCWLNGLLLHYTNICHMHHLCHRSQKYHGLHSSVLGCGSISEESNVKLVQLLGERFILYNWTDTNYRRWEKIYLDWENVGNLASYFMCVHMLVCVCVCVCVCSFIAHTWGEDIVRKIRYWGKYLDLGERKLQEAAEDSILRILMIFTHH